jgi:hypothetical protein
MAYPIPYPNVGGVFFFLRVKQQAGVSKAAGLWN